MTKHTTMAKFVDYGQDGFTKICRLGTVKPEWRKFPYSVFVKIEYQAGRLSITGVEGPKGDGDCIGACGQICMHLSGDQFHDFAEGWSKGKIDSLIGVWRRWHLNDMVPGTPKQMEVVRARQAEADLEDALHKESPHAYASKNGFPSYYDMEKTWLKEAGLLVDDGYSFGSKWLSEVVPDEVLDALRGLPDADKQPAWI